MPRSVSAAAIEDQTLDARAAALANHHARASAESIAQADALASHVSATLSAGPLAVHRARHEASLNKACKRFVKAHVDLATNYWKEKSTDDYKQPALALRMKR